MPKIFDFDLTITAKHTFADYQAESTEQMGNFDEYQRGKEFAKTMLKKDIENYLKHDSENLSAIATFHNNPHFVAGCIAVILDKELTFQQMITSQDKDRHDVAANIYSISGEKNPFYISYIPAAENFNEAKYTIFDKNDQIELIRDHWIESKLINDQTVIDFYDDSSTNYYQSINRLKFINGYLVAAKNEQFTISKSMKSSMNQPEAASSYSSAKSIEAERYELNGSIGDDEAMEIILQHSRQQVEKVADTHQTQQFFKPPQPQKEDKQQVTEPTDLPIKK